MPKKTEPSTLEKDFAAVCGRQPGALVARYEDRTTSYSWTIGRKKAFAVWHYREEQRGPHVRSNDASVRADPRVKPSTISVKYMEKTNNFVWLDPNASWPAEELERLVAASAALAARKDGGVKRGGEFADLFIVLRKALTAAPPHLRPPPPYHAGGPAAKILGNEGPSSRALALWAARQLEPPPEEQKDYDKAIDLAERNDARYDALWAAAYKKGGSPALAAARAAQLAHGSMAGGYETRASSYAAECACLLLDKLVASGDADKTRAFLAEIDDRILNAEFAAVARERAEREDVECERVLWRGSDAKGNAGKWIARLTPDRYALLAKMGPRWQWVEGTRDDVLASVPDTDFQAATAIVMQRDVPGKFGVGAVVRNPRWAYRKKS